MSWCGFLHVYFVLHWASWICGLIVFIKFGKFSAIYFFSYFFLSPPPFSFWRQCPGSEDCYTNSSAGSFPRSLVVFPCMCTDHYSAKGSLVWQWHRACVRIILCKTEKVRWIHLWETLNSQLSNADFSKRAVGSHWTYSHVEWNDWLVHKIASAGDHTQHHQ